MSTWSDFPTQLIEETFPYSVILPSYRQAPQLYDDNCEQKLMVNTEIYAWLEDMLGQGSESLHPAPPIIKRSNWYIKQLGNFASKTLQVMFRNKNDAVIFKLTWTGNDFSN